MFDSPTELHELIKELNLINNRARVVAGYCWEWASKTSPLAFDIVLEEGHYQKRWNLTQDGSIWIISPNSVEEVGCIHTCQGIKQLCQTAPAKALAAADEIIKNTYRTLMTRGMKGCYVYSSDPETREYFAGRLRAEAV